MILFSELFSRAKVVPDAISGDIEITTLVMDSRKATPGCCFVCMPSETGDSHRFLSSAQDAGAVAAIVHSREGFEKAVGLGLASAFVEPKLAGGTPSQCAPLTGVPLQGKGEGETPEQRIRRTTGGFSEAMWRLAKVAFGDPSSKLKVIGVTGTNGKTTTAWLIRDMLNLLGIPCAYIGTLGFGLPLGVRRENGALDGKSADVSAHSQEELRPLENTTPFSIELNAMLAECVERGCQAVAMEVSSHALAERRVDGIEFDVAVFTNLSQDHLDYHGTMEAYEAAKWRLFSDVSLAPMNGGTRGSGGEGSVAVINAHDRLGARWIQAQGEHRSVVSYAKVEQLSAGMREGLDFEGYGHEVKLTSIWLWFQTKHEGDWGLVAPLGGEYNVDNLTASVAVVNAIGFSLGDINEAANVWLRPVPGRFEPVPNDSGIGIIVDYAHTPDALEKLLATVRPLTKGRVITVFGCGGDRDKSKRPLMARAAQEGSDVVVVTSDNPRTEDPEAIVRDCLSGLDGLDGLDGTLSEQPIQRIPPIHPIPSIPSIPSIHVVIDRPAAVALAIRLAEPGDTVVIAGKGHENYQIIGREKIHMDDRELAREGLRLRDV